MTSGYDSGKGFLIFLPANGYFDSILRLENATRLILFGIFTKEGMKK